MAFKRKINLDVLATDYATNFILQPFVLYVKTLPIFKCYQSDYTMSSILIELATRYLYHSASDMLHSFHML